MVITACRVCGNSELLPILDLGTQAITSVFPAADADPVPEIPLELIRCSPAGCGLVQLRHTTSSTLMYGTGSYGYRSNIRPFMINHLRGQVDRIRELVELSTGDLVVDIGSNDGTLLAAYPTDLTLVGVDPNGEQFRDTYPPGAELIADYFTRPTFTARYGDRKAKVVTSIAMFYDLPRPLEMMQDIADILDDDGIWVSEQSYLPSMLSAGAYDVICHEHLEYYALRQFEWMAERVGLTLIHADITPVYGGSLRLTMAKNARYPVDTAQIDAVRRHEASFGLDTPQAFDTFAGNATRHRETLREFLDESRRAGRLTLGYGASTKGNVILQYCGVTTADLPVIGEPNASKWGCVTPGTRIPIVSEEEAHSRKPDQLLVLPWVYRDGFLERERPYLDNGGTLVFPLPELDIVTGNR